MGRSGHSLNISFASGSFASCNLYIIQIRYRDSWMDYSFFRKSALPKRITTKKKYNYSFKPYRRLPCEGRMKEERTFHQLESRKAFTCLQFDECKQTTFCSVYGEFPAPRNVIESKMKMSITSSILFRFVDHVI